MASNILCGPCSHINKRKNAQKWCSNCEEGFCADCEQAHRSMKVTRDHTLISIDDYRKIENVPVNLKCDIHGKKFDLYCKTHDVAMCVACFPAQHKNCSDVVISLDEAASNSKTSTALDDLVDSINGTLENIKHCINNRNASMKNLKIQEQSVRNSITEKRANLNNFLDELEKKLLDDLSERYRNYKSNYEKVLNHLNKTEKEIQLLKEQTSQLKRVGSDLQVFLGTRQINTLIHTEVQSVKSMMSSVQDYKIGVQMHPDIISLLDDIDNFGKIAVEENTISLPFKDAKVEQAQIVHTPTSRSFDFTRLNLRHRFNIKHTNKDLNITGCAVLPNNNLLIADYHGDDVIMEYSEKGRHIRNIQVSESPFDLTVMNSDTIAVAFNECMEIVKIEDNKVLAKVTFRWKVRGISFQNGKIYILAGQDGLVEMDMSGNRLRTIEGSYFGLFNNYVTTTCDRIYCSSMNNNEVYCCSMTGEHIWTFTDQSLVNTRGISVDSEQNVFVVGKDSNKLMMIKHDGNVSRMLLTESDGLNNPKPMYHNKEKKMLLICNESDGEIFVYSVT